jgi:hypothetical protein
MQIFDFYEIQHIFFTSFDLLYAKMPRSKKKRQKKTNSNTRTTEPATTKNETRDVPNNPELDTLEKIREVAFKTRIPK